MKLITLKETADYRIHHKRSTLIVLGKAERGAQVFDMVALKSPQKFCNLFLRPTHKPPDDD